MYEPISDYISYEEEILFEVSTEFEDVMRILLEISQNIIICDYGYPDFRMRNKYGSAVIHHRFRTEKMSPNEKDFIKKVEDFFGKADISFFVDFWLIKTIAEKLRFPFESEPELEFEIYPLHKFIFDNLYNSREITEKILFNGENKTQNILSLSDVMTGWGNFFVTHIGKREK
jgi:hypothetical protein